MAKDFTKHPDFMRVSGIASDAVLLAAQHSGCTGAVENDDVKTGAVVDTLTRHLLNCIDKTRARQAAIVARIKARQDAAELGLERVEAEIAKFR